MRRMVYCSDCAKADNCIKTDGIPKIANVIPGCEHGKKKPMTNADRIRAMSDEELAKWLEKHDFAVHGMGAKKRLILDWLKSPVEVDDET